MPKSTKTDQILDSLVEEVVILNPRGEIVEVNEAWRDFARRGGIPVRRVSEGVNYLDVLRDAASDDLEIIRVLESLEAILDGSLHLFEHEYRCPNQVEMRWFSQRATPLREPLQGAVVTHIDITGRKVAEQERDAHRLELDRAVCAATLGQLSGAIAHELNQPLTAILANSQAGSAIAGERRLAGEVVDIFEDIEKDAQHARKVIERLRSILRHRASVRSESVDLNGVIQEVLALCRVELAAREIEVKTELQSGLAHVRGDSIGLQQVLLNLIVNAYEAMSESGKIKRVLTLRTHMADRDCVVVTVADSGPGVSQADRDRLFEPLFTTKESGLGLGLSISRSIVEAQDGQLTFSNAPAGGAEVTVHLPAQESGT